MSSRRARDRADVSRRSFLGRAALGAFAVYGAIAGAGASAANARPSPNPCRVRCAAISKTGCACGGNLYRCSGCGSRFHACIAGRVFTGFCLRRRC
jgi:hypothetical protein